MQAGDVLAGRYAIVRSIGEGAAGTVYEAREVAFGRRVAVKVLDPSADAKRIAQEARALGALNHPNVVALVDAQLDASPPFLVMDLALGQSLDAMIRDLGRIEPRRAALIAAQLLSALGAAHRAGIIHRDVKPANVIVGERDLVKVVDFGIAKLMIDPLKNTTAGALVGSLAYMSPEHVLGRPLDTRTDIYASGVTLYKMLSGRIPFDGASAAHVVIGITEQEPPPLAVPPELGAIIDRAMRKRAEERWQTADEMRVALEAFAARPELAPSHLASTGPPPQLATKVMPITAPPPSKKGIAVAIAAIALTILVGSGVAAWFLVPRRAPRLERPIAIDVDKGVTQAEEDAIRRKLPDFERCFAGLKTTPAPGTKATVVHGDSVSLANPGGMSTDLRFILCIEQVDAKIPVRANVRYYIRL